MPPKRKLEDDGAPSTRPARAAKAAKQSTAAEGKETKAVKGKSAKAKKQACYGSHLLLRTGRITNF